MTTQPTPLLTAVADSISNLYTQFQRSPVISGIVAAYGVQCQELEILFVNLIVLRSLALATFAQLDMLGKIVGEARKGRDDAAYRIAIGAKARGTRSNGTIDDIIAVLKAAYASEYEVTDLGYTSFVIRMIEPVSLQTAQDLDAILQKIRPAGVRGDFVWSLYDDDTTFALSETDTTTTDLDQGLDGGYLVDVV